MRKPSLILSLSAALAAAAGLSVGALATGPEGVGLSTPTHAPIAITTDATCAEDAPCWDCELMGNRACGDLTDSQKSAAWDAWDAVGGWSKLRTTCQDGQESKIDVIGRNSLTPPKAAPAGETAIPATDGNWYLFTERCI